MSNSIITALFLKLLVFIIVSLCTNQIILPNSLSLPDISLPGYITISVEQGFQLSLDLCLQLINLQQQRAPVRLTKLYCVLYSKLAYQSSTQNDGTNKDQKSYSPWKDEELVEMSNKLFHHANVRSGKMQEVSGRCDRNSCSASAVVQFEPNETGQGFSSCLLDVSRFPVGTYEMKWLSCCIDHHGSYWKLLPLSDKPVFSVKKAS